MSSVSGRRAKWQPGGCSQNYWPVLRRRDRSGKTGNRYPGSSTDKVTDGVQCPVPTKARPRQRSRLLPHPPSSVSRGQPREAGPGPLPALIQMQLLNLNLSARLRHEPGPDFAGSHGHLSRLSKLAVRSLLITFESLGGWSYMQIFLSQNVHRRSPCKGLMGA